MDFNEKVSLLKKYKDAVKLAEYYREELEQYRATKEQAGIQRIDDMPHAKGNQKDLSYYIVELEKKEGKLYKSLLKAERLKTNIAVWCESLEDVDERLVIKYHYIQMHNYGWIADTLHFMNVKTIQRKHDKAINHLPDPDFKNLWIS